MRIIAGKFKGRILQVPKGLPVRPTTDRTRESLFNILQNQYEWEGLRVLDLFSGTGSISLEFASRGVASVTAVDRHARCLSTLRRMADQLGIQMIKTVKMDVLQYTRHITEQFDLIFIDPPYAMPGQEDLLRILFERSALAAGGTLILEHSSQLKFEHIPHFDFSRSYGSSTLSFFNFDSL